MYYSFKMNYDAAALRRKIELVADRTMVMPLPTWNWGEGVALMGLYRAWQATGNKQYLAFIDRWTAQHLPAHTAKLRVNTTIPAYAAALASEQLNGDGHQQYVRGIADFLAYKHDKLSNGALMHTFQEQSQLWVDTLFMAGVFMAYAGNKFDEPNYGKEAVHQFLSHLECLQSESGLCFHGYDDASGRNIGTYWARGNSWILAGFADLTELIADGHPDMAEIKRRVTLLADGLLARQDVSGSWHTVLDETFTYLETSATAGFAYGLLKSFRLQAMDPAKYGEMAERALLWLLSHIGEDGTVNKVSAGTPVLINSIVYNEISDSRIQSWGQGLALMALSECFIHLEQ